jgi:hypothetical protein
MHYCLEQFCMVLVKRISKILDIQCYICFCQLIINYCSLNYCYCLFIFVVIITFSFGKKMLCFVKKKKKMLCSNDIFINYIIYYLLRTCTIPSENFYRVNSISKNLVHLINLCEKNG